MSGYFYTLPAPVFYDKDLSDQAKLLACVIANFCNKYGTCTVTNKNLGEVMGKSERTVSRLVSELSDAGFIQVIVDNLDANKRTITLTTKMSTPHDKNDYTSRQICLHNNTKDNNTKYNSEFGQIVDYLNQKSGSNFKATNDATKRLISARLNEGYTVEDFKKVIDNQVARWTGTEYEEYLQPSTLFAPTKFEKYLNFALKQQTEKPKPIIKA